MPDRILRSAILTSDRVNAVSWGAEVFYRRLMSVVDDFGRFDGRASILRANIYALKLASVSESDIGKWIRECEEAALVRLYQVENRPYLEIPRFNQRMRATASKWPAPPSSADNCGQVPAECGHPPPYSYAESETKTEAKKPPATPEALPFASAEFQSAWSLFTQHRREIRKPLTPTASAMALEMLGRIGEPRAVRCIRHTIEKGWQGLREPDGAGTVAYTPTKQALTEPQGWKSHLNHAYPDSVYSAGGQSEADEWANLPREVQEKLIRELRTAA